MTKKLLLLLCLTTLSTLNTFTLPTKTTTALAAATVAPMVGNFWLEGSNSYIAELGKSAVETLKACGSKEAAELALKYGSTATIISILMHNPQILRTGLTMAGNAAQGISGNILALADGCRTTAHNAWNNKRDLTKVTLILGAIIGANCYIRGDKSIIAHVAQKGFPGIVPAIGNQIDATVNYAISLFKKAQ